MTKASDNAFPSVLITEGTEPSAPAAGKQRVYIDSTTHHLKRTDSSGTDVDLETNQSSGGVATDSIWDATGDLVRGTGANTGGRLAIGSTGDVLTVVGGTAAWATPSGVGAIGYMPWALPPNVQQNATHNSGGTLPANGGSRAVVFYLNSPMLLDSVFARNTDSGSTRTWGWDLYYQNSAASATCTRVANSNADESFTGATGFRSIVAASAPVLLQPGTYWAVIQNRHATNTFNLSAVATSTFGNMNQSKTTTNPNGATLDMSTGWTRLTSVQSVYLAGRVFNEGALF